MFFVKNSQNVLKKGLDFRSFLAPFWVLWESRGGLGAPLGTLGRLKRKKYEKGDKIRQIGHLILSTFRRFLLKNAVFSSLFSRRVF